MSLPCLVVVAAVLCICCHLRDILLLNEEQNEITKNTNRATCQVSSHYRPLIYRLRLCRRPLDARNRWFDVLELGSLETTGSEVSCMAGWLASWLAG